MASKNPASLFTGRVQNYIKYRPMYPLALLDLLAQRCGLKPDSAIADMGSGTGILTELFLKRGYPVLAVEPNSEMREAGEQLLGHYRNFTSVAGSAEATRLPPASVDLVTAGQAFHWFNHLSAHAEFMRILRPGGWVALIWNMARTVTPFEKEYNEFWRIDLRGAHEARDGYEALIQPFFAGGHYERAVLEGVPQVMSRDELTGRILSISAAIQPGELGFDDFLKKIQGMFERNQENGCVTLTYDTEVYFGQLVM